MIIERTLVQGTDAWVRAKLGVLSASRADQLLTPKTLKLSSQAEGLAVELAAERITGEPDEAFAGTYWTDRGSEMEGQAAAYFSLQTDLTPQSVGFVYKDESRETGCSPDWMCFDSGGDPTAGVEFKVPKRRTHGLYVINQDADKYRAQLQFSLWVTQLPVWYFMSYCPGLKPLLRVEHPIAEWQEAFDKHVPLFLDRVKGAEEALRP